MTSFTLHYRPYEKFTPQQCVIIVSPVTLLHLVFFANRRYAKKREPFHWRFWIRKGANQYYYMARSAKGQDEANPVFWLATLGQDGSILPARDCPLCSRKSEILWCSLNFGHMINPLLSKREVKMAGYRGFAWRPCCMAGTIKMFCIRMNILSHRNNIVLFTACNMAARAKPLLASFFAFLWSKTNFGQYPAILTSHLVNKSYVIFDSKLQDYCNRLGHVVDHVVGHQACARF